MMTEIRTGPFGGGQFYKNILTKIYMYVIFQIEFFECVVKRMEQIYIDTAKMLRAISDPKRLRIVDMLSCGELCACKILEEFHITQPTWDR